MIDAWGLAHVVLLSLESSGGATLVASVIGLPLGAWLAIRRFVGRGGVILVANALLGLPPVVVGLGLYLLLSRSGPWGGLGLLFTPGGQAAIGGYRMGGEALFRPWAEAMPL